MNSQMPSTRGSGTDPYAYGKPHPLAYREYESREDALAGCRGVMVCAGLGVVVWCVFLATLLLIFRNL